MVTVLGSKTKPYKKKKTSINQVDYNIEVDFFVTNVEVDLNKLLLSVQKKSSYFYFFFNTSYIFLKI